MKKYALLIGNGEHVGESDLPPLKYPKRDVYKLEHTLDGVYNRIKTGVYETSYDAFAQCAGFLQLKEKRLLSHRHRSSSIIVFLV